MQSSTVGGIQQFRFLGDLTINASDVVGVVALRSKLTPIAKGTSVGQQLSIADFSEVKLDGTYRVEIAEGFRSAEFRIAKNVYNWPLYSAVRAMYLWRCGCAVDAMWDGDRFQHPACHTDDAYLKYVGGADDQRRDGTGGWHDAGDFNKYTVNGAFSVGVLLKAWEHFPDKLRSLAFGIPESGNQVPDVLDELRWEIEWLLKMQADDGRVYHKLSTLNFGGFILPAAENERRYFSPWSSAATADFAAAMAESSRAFQPFDKTFAVRCLSAAKKSYEFLGAHPEEHHPDLSAFTTGPYDAPDLDDRIWAAAELWETTGEAGYLRQFEHLAVNAASKAECKGRTLDVDWDWGTLRNLGVFTYLLSERSGRDPAAVSRIRDDTLNAAKTIIAAHDSDPYARPLGSSYYWGCNGTVARQAINLHVAHLLTSDEQYRAAMLDAVNYLLGRNPFGRSFVTGVGHRPPLFPHDRRSRADNVKAPWPGYLVGGPWPGPRDWHDEADDYRTNEIAINWNCALIYALAAFVEPQSFDASVKASRFASPNEQSSER